LVLPLFPQYSATTAGTILDAVFAELQTWRWIPHLHTISDYHDHPAYIRALAQHIRLHWDSSSFPEHLIFSFHGIPQDYVQAGDPYEAHCHRTASLLAAQLNLSEGQRQTTFQSRFGPQTWLQPYTDQTLQALGQQRLTSLGVVCPGFAVDCLETIDEIGHEGRDNFQSEGGGSFDYVPALNDTPLHIEALADVILSEWLPAA
jgi:ferrochelatase